MPGFKEGSFDLVKAEENAKIGEIVDKAGISHLEKTKSVEEVILMYAHQYAETENLMAKVGFDQDALEDELSRLELERGDLEDLLDNENKKGVGTLEKGKEELQGEALSQKLEENVLKYQKTSAKLEEIKKSFASLKAHRDGLLELVKPLSSNAVTILTETAARLEELKTLNPLSENN